MTTRKCWIEEAKYSNDTVRYFVCIDGCLGTTTVLVCDDLDKAKRECDHWLNPVREIERKTVYP